MWRAECCGKGHPAPIRATCPKSSLADGAPGLPGPPDLPEPRPHTSTPGCRLHSWLGLCLGRPAWHGHRCAWSGSPLPPSGTVAAIPWRAVAFFLEAPVVPRPEGRVWPSTLVPRLAGFLWIHRPGRRADRRLPGSEISLLCRPLVWAARGLGGRGSGGQGFQRDRRAQGPLASCPASQLLRNETSSAKHPTACQYEVFVTLSFSRLVCFGLGTRRARPPLLGPYGCCNKVPQTLVKNLDPLSVLRPLPRGQDPPAATARNLLQPTLRTSQPCLWPLGARPCAPPPLPTTVESRSSPPWPHVHPPGLQFAPDLAI